MGAPQALPVVRVLGLGPGDANLLTVATAERLRTADPTRSFLRTRVHPAAVTAAGHLPSFDHVYEASKSFEDVYRTIVNLLVEASETAAAGADAAVAAAGSPPDGGGADVPAEVTEPAEALYEVLYVVPGSPMVAEHTVELLLADPRVRVIVEPAMSFVDLTWVRLGIDPVTHGVRIVDGHRFATDPPTFDTPMLIGQCHAVSVLSDVKLALDLEAIDEIPVATVVHHLGLPSERIAVVAWPDLDRLSTVVGIEPDHLTSLYVPALALGAGPVIRRLEDQMRALRARCPWDREQTHASLAKYAIEEAAELVEAISFLDAASMPNGEDPVEALEEELGDVLFQVLFHACVAAEEGWFDLTDVARTLFTKMERRHPHVFGGPDGLGAVSYPDAASVKADWEAIKAAERAAKAADRLPRLT